MRFDTESDEIRMSACRERNDSIGPSESRSYGPEPEPSIMPSDDWIDDHKPASSWKMSRNDAGQGLPSYQRSINGAPRAT
jgi:hypothetical protein